MKTLFTLTLLIFLRLISTAQPIRWGRSIHIIQSGKYPEQAAKFFPPRISPDGNVYSFTSFHDKAVFQGDTINKNEDEVIQIVLRKSDGTLIYEKKLHADKMVTIQNVSCQHSNRLYFIFSFMGTCSLDQKFVGKADSVYSYRNGIMCLDSAGNIVYVNIYRGMIQGTYAMTDDRNYNLYIRPLTQDAGRMLNDSLLMKWNILKDNSMWVMFDKKGEIVKTEFGNSYCNMHLSVSPSGKHLVELRPLVSSYNRQFILKDTFLNTTHLGVFILVLYDENLKVLRKQVIYAHCLGTTDISYTEKFGKYIDIDDEGYIYMLLPFRDSVTISGFPLKGINGTLQPVWAKLDSQFNVKWLQLAKNAQGIYPHHITRRNDLLYSVYTSSYPHTIGNLQINGNQKELPQIYLTMDTSGTPLKAEQVIHNRNLPRGYKVATVFDSSGIYSITIDTTIFQTNYWYNDVRDMFLVNFKSLPAHVNQPSEKIEGENNLRVFPNPVQDILNIYWQANNNEWIELTDISGRLVFRSILPTGAMTHLLKIQELPAGIYVLRIPMANVATKLIKVN